MPTPVTGYSWNTNSIPGMSPHVYTGSHWIKKTGDTWQNSTTISSASGGNCCRMSSLDFISDSVGIRAMYFDDGWGTVYTNMEQTLDGGATWNYSFGLIFSINPSLSFPGGSTANGYFMNNEGFNSSLYRFTNHTASWVLQTTPVYNGRSAHFTSMVNGFCVSRDSMIYHTADSGKSWLRVYGQQGLVLGGIYFPSPGIGYAVGSNGFIAHTLDSGATWTTQVSNVTNRLNSVYFINDLVGYAVGDLGTIVQTADGGQTWTPQVSPVSSNLTHIHFSNGIGLVYTSDNKLLSTDPTLGIADQQASEELVTVFPNPASEQVTVTFKEPGTILGLVLTDLTGRSLAEIQTGREPRVNLRLPAAGLYILQISTAEGKIVRKIVAQ